MLNWVAGSVGARIAVERHQLGQRPVADDDAGGVGRGVAVEAFELQRDVDQARDRRLVASRSLLQHAARRRSPCCSVTGLAGLFGTILHRRSTWP